MWSHLPSCGGKGNNRGVFGEVAVGLDNLCVN